MKSKHLLKPRHGLRLVISVLILGESMRASGFGDSARWRDPAGTGERGDLIYAWRGGDGNDVLTGRQSNSVQDGVADAANQCEWRRTA